MATTQRGWKQFLEEHEYGDQTSDPSFWDQYLQANPDVLHRLLADLFRLVHGDRSPTIDDLATLVQKQTFAHEPFGDAVLAALDGRSIRWLAQQVGLHHSLLDRLISNKRPIISPHDPEGSMRKMEGIARALRLHPSYFREWRYLWAVSVLGSVFERQPGVSVDLFRRYVGAQIRSGNGR